MTSVFIPVSILGRNLYKIVVKRDDVNIENVKFNDITIDNNTFKGWTFKDNKNYSLIMFMNDKGEEVLYQYESSENTLQLYHQQKEEPDNTMTYIFMLTTALFALTTIGSFIYLYLFKKKSIAAIKAYYER